MNRQGSIKNDCKINLVSSRACECGTKGCEVQHDRQAETSSLTIYRVQDKDGRGPWKPGFSHRWVEERPDHDNLPPWFVEFGRVDLKVIVGAWCGSGCDTVKQLRRWFTESEYRKLQKLGYHAVKMEVGRIIARSDKQLCFERAKPLNKEIELVEIY